MTLVLMLVAVSALTKAIPLLVLEAGARKKTVVIPTLIFQYCR